jgi:hypothetical protein
MTINNHPSIMSEVDAEVISQFDQWGEQNHPLSYGDEFRIAYANAEMVYKAMNTARVETNTLTWDGILLEEVYEALGTTDVQQMRAELIQVAAVAVSMADYIDRHSGVEVCKVEGQACLFECEAGDCTLLAEPEDEAA